MTFAFYFLTITVGFLIVLSAILIIRMAQLERDQKLIAGGLSEILDAIDNIKRQRKTRFWADNDA